MIEFYLPIKALHIGLVIASGLLFLLRGGLALSGWHGANHIALRYLSYSIDTTLLTAALMLMSMLHLSPIAQHWLGLKLMLLLVYVLLGIQVMRGTQSRSRRALYFGLALLVFLSMFGIARAHHPLGWLRWWGWC